MGFCTDIHVPQWMNPTDFGELLTFYLLPPAGLFDFMNFGRHIVVILVITSLALVFRPAVPNNSLQSSKHG